MVGEGAAFATLDGRAPDGTAYSLTQAPGNAAPVVLIHGVGLDRTMWRPAGAAPPERGETGPGQVAALAALGPVLSYDMLGHGETRREEPKPPGGPAGRSLGDFVAQFAALLDHLGIERCRPVGFSMGGLVARAFAAGQPERVERLVLMSTVFERDERARAAVEARCETVVEQGLAVAVEPALERWFTPEFAAARPELVEQVRRQMLSNDPAGYLAAYRVFATADREPGAALAGIGCPVLVMTGSDDANSTPAMAVALAARMPHAEAAVLPGRRHMMPLEAAGEVNRLLLEFLG